MNQQTISVLSKLFSSVFTFDNLTFVLGLIGSLGTAWGIFQSRVRIDMKVIKYGHSENKILIYVAFYNKSRLAISINGISLKISDTYYSCTELPTRVDHRTYYIGKEITGQSNYFNMNMPINISGLAGTSGYILFELPKDTDILESNQMTFLISPNRGSAIEKKCQLPQEY